MISVSGQSKNSKYDKIVARENDLGFFDFLDFEVYIK